MVVNREIESGALVRAFQADVWRYLRVLGCEASLAEDLTQETFISVLRKPFEERSDKETRSYLRTVARNLFLKALRQEKSRPNFHDIDSLDPFSTDVGNSSNAYVDALRICVEKLDERERRIFEMRYGEEQSGKDIGKALDLREDHINTLVKRSKIKLRECVEQSVSAEEK